MIKVNLLDAHDRLKHFHKQADYVSKGCADCIKNRPEEFGTHPFYIFAHARTADDGVTKRIIWQPRLSKPTAQTNSMLFKAYPPGDVIKVIWMIPDSAMWGQYIKDNLTESKIIIESIHAFRNNREKLEAKEEDDLSNDQINEIYNEISCNAQLRKTISMLGSSEEFLTSS